MNKHTQPVDVPTKADASTPAENADRTLVDPLFASSRTSDEYEKTVRADNFHSQHSQTTSLDGDKTVLDPHFHRTNNSASNDLANASPQTPAGKSSDKTVSQRSTPLPASTATLALPLGFKLHEYRIDSVLGQGGFGITYLATDVHLNAKVAVKEYLPEEFATRSSDKSVSPRRIEDREFYQHALDCFLIEARTLATFRHPNIVRVARFFEANETAYMVLEYERGKSLKSWWRTHADISEHELLALLLPLLDGLAVVHETGYLHRDIKPDNIYVRQDDGSLVLLDFGAARQTAGTTDGMSSVVTPGYGPIEQHENGNQGPWTDIYALGATLYYMITGKKPPPSPERTGAIDPMIPAEEAGKGRFSPEFLRAIDWALKPLPEDRPQNIAAFCQALYAAHASKLNLQAALMKAGDDSEEGDGWLARVQAPRSLKGRLIRFGRNLLRPGSWPMAVKMTLAMVLTALMPMLITAYYNLSGSLSAVSTSEMRNLEQLAQSTAGRVAQLVNDSRNLASYLGTDEDFVSFLEAPTENGKRALRAKLDGLVKANPDVHLLMVMDPEGTAVVSSDPAVTGRNFKFREYFKVAMEGRPYTTGIVVGAVAGAAGVFYSHPVIDPASNKVIGVVVLRLKASSITSILDEMRHGSQRTPFMIDGDGIVIHHPDPTLLYRSLAPLPKETIDQIIADQRFRRDHIDTLNMPDLAHAMVGTQKQGNISYKSTISGTEEIVGFAPVRGHNWVVGVTESRAFFAEPLNRLFANVLYSVLLVGIVFLMLALLFARTIVQPIRELNAAAHALKSGDYDRAGIRVTSNDEIGQLARTFNVMIDVLRQRERERERMNRRTGATDTLREGGAR